MTNWKRGLRILLLAACILNMAALLLPGSGAANSAMSHEEWVVTPAAAQGTAQGRCPDGEICKELCEVRNTTSGSEAVEPLGYFECFNL